MLQLQGAARSAQSTATALGAHRCSMGTCACACPCALCEGGRLLALVLRCCGRVIAGQPSAVSSYQLKMHFPGRVIRSCAQHGGSRALNPGRRPGTWGRCSDMCRGRALAVTPGGARPWGAGWQCQAGGDVADPGDRGSTGRMTGLCSGVWPARICWPQCLLCAGAGCTPCPAPGFVPGLAAAYCGDQRF